MQRVLHGFIIDVTGDSYFFFIILCNATVQSLRLKKKYFVVVERCCFFDVKLKIYFGRLETDTGNKILL
jgi:hypothetical protein